MTLENIILFIIVPTMGMIGFPSLALSVAFCFNISKRVTTLESDYRHMEKNVKQGFSSVQLQLDKMDKNIEKLLAHANQQEGQRRRKDDVDPPAIDLPGS